jgi:hypothetical protein
MAGSDQRSHVCPLTRGGHTNTNATHWGGVQGSSKDKTLTLVQSIMAIFMPFSVQRMSLPGDRI